MKRLWLLALIGAVLIGLSGCADKTDDTPIHEGELVDSSIVVDSAVVAAPVECMLEYGINADEGRARVGTSIVSIPSKSEVWFCSPILVLPGSSVSLPVGTRLSWKSGTGSTQVGILEEMPMIVMVR